MLNYVWFLFILLYFSENFQVFYNDHVIFLKQVFFFFLQREKKGASYLSIWILALILGL